MAVGSRASGMLPVAGAAVAAIALAGVAVVTVSNAGCGEPGRYVRHEDGSIELVGSCLDPAHLPAAPAEYRNQQTPAEPANLVP